MTSPTGNCKQIFELLSDYLDLDLPPDACAEIEAHLAGCPPCVEFMESLRKTVELCRRYQPAELPVSLSQHLREQLRQTYEAALARK